MRDTPSAKPNARSTRTRRAARRPAAGRFRRPLRVEVLEDRTLLDGNAPLGAAKAPLLAGLQGLSDWSRSLNSFGKLGQQLAVIDQSIGQALDIASIVQHQLTDKVQAASLTYTDDVVNVLRALGNGTGGSLTLTVDPTRTSGGLVTTTGGSELDFNLAFTATRTATTCLDLGSQAGKLGWGAGLDATFTLKTTLTFGFTFGYNLAPGLTPADAFFIRVNNLTAAASVQAANNLNFHAQLGLLGVQVQNGSLNLSAGVSVSFVAPDQNPQGTITLNQLRNTDLSALLTVTPTGSATLSATLPLLARLGSYTFGGTPTITVSSGDLFGGAAPTVTASADVSEMLNFTHLSATDLRGMLTELGGALQSAAGALNPANPIPFVSQQVSQVVDFVGLATQFTRTLYDPAVVALQPGPANGRLAQDASFYLQIGSDPTWKKVTVTAASTQYNGSLNDLVTDINNALTTAGLGSQVRAGLAGTLNNQVKLTVTDAQVSQFQIFIGSDPQNRQVTDPTNPAAAVIGLPVNQTSAPLFKFQTFQDLATLIPALNPQYDPATHTLTFALNLVNSSYSQVFPVQYMADIGPLNVLASGKVKFQAAATVSVTAGIELGSLNTVLTGTDALPANGQLTGDAHFQLAVGSGTPVAVTVYRKTTNTTVDDLVADVNTALTAAGLGNQVAAGKTTIMVGGQTVTVLTLTSQSAAVLQVSPMPNDPGRNDPAFQQLHLPTLASATPWSQRAFVAANGQVRVSSSLVADGTADHDTQSISGSAAVGPVGVQLHDGTINIRLNTGVTLTAASGRVHLGDLVTSSGTVLTVQPLTVNNFAIHLPVTVSLVPGLTLPFMNAPAVDISLARPNDLTSIQVLPNSGFSDFFNNLKNFSFDSLAASLLQFATTAGVNLGPFAGKLPFTNTTLADLLGLKDKLTNGLAGLTSAVADSDLQNFIGQFDTALMGLTLSDDLQAQFLTVRNALSAALADVEASPPQSPVGSLVTAAGALGSVLQSAPAAVKTAFQPLLDKLLGQNGQSALIPALQTLVNRLIQALGLTGTVELFVTQDKLLAHFKKDYTLTASSPSFQFSVGGFGLITASGSSIPVSLGASLDLYFGVKTSGGAPAFFLDRRTQITLSAQVDQPNFQVTASILGISVQLGSGPITLKNSAGTGPATLTLSVNANQPDGTIDLTDLGNAGALSIVPNGQFNANLPIIYQGHGLGNLTWTWDLRSANVPAPQVPSDLLSQLLNNTFNFDTLAAGLDTFLARLQDILINKILTKLPLIGGDLAKFRPLTDLITSLRTQFVTGLKTLLQSGPGGQDDVQTRVEDYIYTTIGTGSTGLALDPAYRKPDGTAPMPHSANDRYVEANININNPTSTIFFGLKDTIQFDLPLDFHLGGLGMRFDSTLALHLTASFHAAVNIGVSKTTGFFYQVAADPNQSEISLSLDQTTFSGGLSATLAFLTISATNNPSTPEFPNVTGITGSLGLKLNPAGGGSTFTLPDLAQVPNLTFHSSVAAHVNMKLDAKILNSDQWPHLTATLIINWSISNDPAMPQGLTDAKLAHISLDLGTYLSSIVGPIIDKVHQYLQPLEPIRQVLETQIPVISQLSQLFGGGPVRFIDALKTLGSGFDSLDYFLKVYDTIESVLALIHTGQTLSVDFGTLDFNTGKLTGGITGQDDNTDYGNFTPALTGGIGGLPNSTTKNDLQRLANSPKNPSNGLGISFPLFDDPKRIVNLFFGKPVDLVVWDVPQFDAKFRFHQIFGPILPPIPPFVTIDGAFEIRGHLIVGYDTRGFQVGNPLNGLYFVASPSQPVLSVSAEIAAGAELNVIVAEAGVRGGIRGEITASWHDPDHDGKLYLDELTYNLTHLGIGCIFDLHGDLSAFLEAFVKIGFDTPFGFVTLWSASFTIVKVTLIDFNYSCPPATPAVLAHYATPQEQQALGLVPDTLIVNIGPFAGQRRPHDTDGDESISVSQKADGVLELAGFGQDQTYGNQSGQNKVKALYIDGGAGSNYVSVDSSVTVPATLKGGSGSNTISGGSGFNYIEGHGGHDLFTGGDGPMGNVIVEKAASTATLIGGNGADATHGDTITVAGGNNLIEARKNKATITGGLGNDTIRGGVGDDVIYGGVGHDSIFGGPGNNYIRGQGNLGYYIEGGPGNNTIIASDGGDLIYADGPFAQPPAAGQRRFDMIQGGAGPDSIFGSLGTDLIRAGSGRAYIYGGPNGDTIYAGAGSDQIIAGPGNDFIYGGSGSAVIHGGGGDDYVEAGTGSLDLYADSGNVLLKQTADADMVLTDTSLSGLGRDTLHGVQRVWLVGGPSNHSIDVSGWTGVATLTGGGGVERVISRNDADFTLSDWNLTRSSGGSFYLQGIREAALTGGPTDNVFDLTRWTGTASITGGGGLDRLVAWNLVNATLTDTSFTRSTAGPVTLSGINQALLAIGPSDGMIDAGGFSGQATLYGGTGNSTLVGGSGGNYIQGGAGTDYLKAGAGQDVIIGGSGSGGTLIGGNGGDVIVGPARGYASITGGTGNDRIWGRGGHNTISGGNGLSVLDAGPGGANTVLANNGRDVLIGRSPTDVLTGNSTSFTYPNSSLANPVPAYSPLQVASQGPATLPTGADYRGRWTELSSSATGAGVSNSPGMAVEPSIAAGAAAEYVAWADNRSGQFEIYVARHTTGAWQELAGSAHNGGVSNTRAPSRRPSLTLDATGQPIVAWTVVSAGGTDVFVARYDPTANGGQGAWVALGSSLGGGGISGTGKADQPVVVLASGGPVVAWLDTSSGVANVYARQFTGGSWVPYGTVTGGGGAASGSGISLSATGVADLTAAVSSDGSRVAVAWTQTLSGQTQIYLREYQGGTWNEVGGSASGRGLSQTAGQAQAPTIAYASGRLFAAWQETVAGGSVQDFAATFNGSAWVDAGSGARSPGGISAAGGVSTLPKLAGNGSRLYLVWLSNRIANGTGNSVALYAKLWNGSRFTEEITGDASYRGIGNGIESPAAPALAVDANGNPFVAWNDFGAGSPQIDVRGNTWATRTVYYVHSTTAVGGSGGGFINPDRLGQAVGGFTLAPGSDTNDGRSPQTPMASLAALVNRYHPGSGDIILVDGGYYGDALTLDAASAGLLLFGSVKLPAVISGTATLDHPAGLVLENLGFGGAVSLLGGSAVTFSDDRFTGAGLILNGGSGTQVIHTSFNTSGTALTLTQGAAGLAVEHNLITSVGGAGVAVVGAGGATGLELRDNRIVAGSTGIQLSVPAAGHVAGNDATAAGTVLAVGAAFTGLIEANTFHGGAVGVAYQAAAALSGNRIADNATGVLSLVAGNVNGFGFVGTTLPNQIFHNATGVNLLGRMQGQHVFANATGVTGSGQLIANDFEHANLIEANVTGVDFAGPIQFQRAARNTVGIAAHGGQLIAHDFLYRNTFRGINVQGQTDVRIFDNTLVAATGDLIRVENRSSTVEVRNNILWAQGGYDIYVANDSTAGFFSDYNDLYATGAGKLVFWTMDFSDILDWQEDVYRFDLHSEGRTVVDPLWAQPRFVGLTLDDYRVFDAAAQQRFTSPTFDTGDPLADQALPAGYQNLLADPGFESGLTGWSVTPSGATLSGPTPAWEGGSYFFAGPNAVTTLEQTVDLTASGFTPAQIDGLNLSAVFGGRVRTTDKAVRDSGTITLVFLDVNGNVIANGTFTAQAQNTVDRWELVGSRVSIPVGARKARFRFTAVRGSGGTNDSYLDGAFLYVQGDAVVPSLGSFGDSYAEATKATDPRLVLRSPDLYKDWELNKPLPIRWDSYGNTSNAPVRIDLYQVVNGVAQFVTNIATSAPDNGEFRWIAAGSGLTYGTYNLRIQISLVGNPAAFDRSTETFTIPENTNTFYVNTADTVNKEYTTAPGSNRNDGKLPSAPKPFPSNVLRVYTPGALPLQAKNFFGSRLDGAGPPPYLK